MSDEAIVRLVIADSTAGARTTDTQSSAAGLSSSAVGGIDPNRLYREIGSVSTEINRGFKTSLAPAVRLLGEIRDVLTQDYNYSEKDYKESTTQTSLLKMIGAQLSGDKGALGREITKGVGLHSSEMQTVIALTAVTAAVRELKLSLTPEAERDRYSLIGSIFKGSLVGLGLVVAKPEILDYINRAVAGAAIIASAAPAIAGAVAAEATNIAGSAVALAAEFPLETAGLIAGAIGGAILYALSPEPPEKEKSTNELLAEILKAVGGKDNNGPLDQIAENTRLTANATSVTFETANKILALMPGHDPYAELGGVDALRMQETDRMGQPSTLEMAGAESENVPLVDMLDLEKSTALPPFLNQTGKRLLGGVGATPVPGAESPPFPTMSGPLAIPIPTATPYNWEEAVVPTATPLLGPEDLASPPDPWEGWQQTYHYPQFLSQAQLNELAPSNVHPEDVPGTGGRQRLTDAGLEQFLQYRERENLGPPQFFASGGAVGSDTVPAMLSPGEVVVPKRMVDGGAVDHLRGKIPGFAAGGLVGNYGLGGLVEGANKTMMGMMDTDPGSRIGKFGQSISAIGDKISTAVPVVGAFVMGLGKAVEGVGMLMGAINETVDKYGEYNGQVAQAQAIVEINQTMGDMRRAQEAGPELAKFVIAQGQLQQKFEEIKIKLLMEIIPAITNILEALDKTVGSGEGISLAINVLVSHIAILGAAAKTIANLQEDGRIKEIDDPTSLLLDPRFTKSMSPIEDEKTRGFVPNR